MLLYRLLNEKTKEVGYIGITADLDKALKWRGDRDISLVNGSWVVEYVDDLNPDEAKSLQREARKALADGMDTDMGLNWTTYKTVDFLAGKERLVSARISMLMLMAMSGGMISCEVGKKICGTQRYFEKTMRTLKDNKEALIVYGKTPHMIQIQGQGCKVIEELVPGTLAKRAANRMNRANPERKADIATTLYICQALGAEILPMRKPKSFTEKSDKLLAYAPYEIKETDESIQGSRLTALLVKGNDAYILYHCGNRNMKFQPAPEQRALSLLESKARDLTFHRVVIGNQEQLKNILHNGELKRRMGAGGKTLEKITPDLNMTFIPTDKAALHLRLMLKPDGLEKLTEYVKKKTGLQTVRALPMTLPILQRLALEKGEIAVLCAKTQEELIAEICPTATIMAVTDENLEKLLKKSIKT